MQEIYKDRKKFSKAVFEVASSDLVNMGIYVVSYTLKDIRDEEVSEINSQHVIAQPFPDNVIVKFSVIHVMKWFEKEKNVQSDSKVYMLASEHQQQLSVWC